MNTCLLSFHFIFLYFGERGQEDSLPLCYIVVRSTTHFLSFSNNLNSVKEIFFFFKKKITKYTNLLLLRALREIMVNNYISNLLLSTLRVYLVVVKLQRGREKGRGGCQVGERKYGWGSLEKMREEGVQLGRGERVENGGEGVFSLGSPFKRKSFLSNLTVKRERKVRRECV